MNAALRDLLTGRGIHLGALTAVLADRYGPRSAIEDPAWTPGLAHGPVRDFDAVEDAVARLAAVHHDVGHGQGRRVLLLVANRIDVVLHLLALARAGAVPVPVNARFTPGEVTAIIAATRADAAVCDARVAGRLGPVLAEADVAVVMTGDEPTGERSRTSLADALDAGDARLPASMDADPDAPAVLLATSGTTGAPKAAVLSSRGLTAAAGRLVGAPVGRPRGLRPGRDLVLASLPLTHVMGLAVALATLTAGVRLLRRARFDAAETLDLVEARRPNVFVGVPTMYADLEAAGAADRDLSSVQLWISSADAMPPDRARRFQRYGAGSQVAGRSWGTAAFADVYGMVELSGPAAVRLYPPSPSPRLRLPAPSVVLPGQQVRALDEDERRCRWGQVGELAFRGGNVLARYETADGERGVGPDAEGWLSTGDLGRVWPGGLFTFAGRSRDRLKVGGFSVFPAEVEARLRHGPGVAEVAVVGVPDERLGERPVAVVVPAGTDFDPDAFLTWARRAVAGYRRPHDVHVVAMLPRGNHGKLDRAAATRLVRQGASR